MRVKLSMQVFGAYLCIAGFGGMVAPDIILSLFGFPPAEDEWIRMFALMAVILGFHYWVAAHAANMSFCKASVVARFFAAGFMVMTFLAGLFPAPILLFAAGDSAGALWTALALRKEAQAAAIL